MVMYFSLPSAPSLYDVCAWVKLHLFFFNKSLACLFVMIKSKLCN